ncbi:bifunctional NADP phosphatase/NAD kinase [Methanococcus voltae]|uniref:bifunctional NADP phosphatase/NAD kinase n=1 Tax=Methanococcus voltae TaxID=2188 RepID=UPI001AE907FE|nr:bifunctional NADP phosphatase/NAD kinase [Methanococcus voltae]MBP2172881.1 NAD+ kinase [Methanococcus voltae]
MAEEMLKMAIKVTENLERSIRPLIGWEKSNEIVKIGADGTPTKRIDLIAENIAISSLEKFCSAILISEEIGFKVIGRGTPKYIVILDPIDGTYNALNDIPIYSVSLAMGKISNDKMEKIKKLTSIGNTSEELSEYQKNLNKILKEFVKENFTINDLSIGVVKNISTGDTYYAEKNKGAYVLKNGKENEKRKIGISNIKNLKDASMGVFAYGLSSETLNFIKDRKIRRIRIFGSIALEMCYVARGSLDAYINVNETTRLCDMAAGYIILKEAGGEITTKNGMPMNLRLDIAEKSSFICSNKDLHKKLVGTFGNKWRLKPTKIGIISRHDNEESLNVAYNTVKYLENRGIDYKLDKGIYNALKDRLNATLMDDVQDISHIISIGGDGTVLRASKLIKGNEIPIICVDMGTVGFLTEFGKEDVYNAIDSVLNGNYTIEKRTKLSGFINYGLKGALKTDDGNDLNKQKFISDALNEVVITTNNPAKIMDFEVYINGILAENVRADGIIVSTPNGSTAYSLSAGGPIIEPTVDAFIIVPICPFKLSSRPLVVDGNSEIKLKVMKKSAMVVVDGSKEEGLLSKGDEITFRKSNSYTYFVKGSNFYNKVKKLSLME